MGKSLNESFNQRIVRAARPAAAAALFLSLILSGAFFSSGNTWFNKSATGSVDEPSTHLPRAGGGRE